MARSVFVVILDHPQDVSEKLREVYGNDDVYSHPSNSTVHFIETGDMASEVKEKIGMNPDAGVEGTVFRLEEPYAGFTFGEFWHWLQKTVLKR